MVRRIDTGYYFNDSMFIEHNSNSPDINLEDYLVPTKELLPEWYKSLKPKQYSNGVSNVKSCPSFMELFHNSYCYISPVSFAIKVEDDNLFFKSDNEEYLTVNSHTSVGYDDSQMGPLWYSHMHNVKIEVNMYVKSSTGRCDMVILPPDYHNPKLELRAAPGIISLIDNFAIQFNLNMFLDSSKTTNVFIKKGDVLAYLYDSDGVLPFKRTDILPPPRPWSTGAYIKSMNAVSGSGNRECPMGH